jgi:hypothetical protein
MRIDRNLLQWTTWLMFLAFLIGLVIGHARWFNSWLVSLAAGILLAQALWLLVYGAWWLLLRTTKPRSA